MPEIKNYNEYMSRFILSDKVANTAHNQKLILEAVLDALYSVSRLEDEVRRLREKCICERTEKPRPLRSDSDVEDKVLPEPKPEKEDEDIEAI